MSDLRGLLASKDLDSIPEIQPCVRRIDDGLHRARDSAVEAAREAARARPRRLLQQPIAMRTMNLGA